MESSIASSMAVSDFLEENKITTNGVGNATFEAFVEYRSQARNTAVITQVNMIRNGYHDGNINIDESDDLIDSKYYLSFDTNYQEYSLNDGKLLINGSGPKVGGKYTITISAVK